MFSGQYQQNHGVTVRRQLTVIILLMTCWYSIAEAATDTGLMTAQGGQLVVTFYRDNLRDAGLTVDGARPLNFQHDTAAIDISHNGKLGFQIVLVRRSLT